MVHRSRRNHRKTSTDDLAVMREFIVPPAPRPFIVVGVFKETGVKVYPGIGNAHHLSLQNTIKTLIACQGVILSAGRWG